MKKTILIIALATLSLLSYSQDRRTMDWAGFNRYSQANAEVKTSPLAVFMGDSITDNWGRRRPTFFTEHDYLSRGISGQTVEHMLSRFHADVVDLHPQVVVILAGINNIAGNNGKITLENVAGCIASMCEIARANQILPIICSVLPCDRFSWNPDVKPAQEVVALNALLKEYASRNGITYVDYYSSMGLPDGSLPKELSEDGCHPTGAGYEIMEAIIVPEIEKVLATR